MNNRVLHKPVAKLANGTTMVKCRHCGEKKPLTEMVQTSFGITRTCLSCMSVMQSSRYRVSA